MQKAELLQLIANLENSGVEIKSDQERPERLAKEIVALANFKGGKLILGVEDDGTITGIRRNDLERWIMDAVFGRKVHPMILPFYEEVQIDDQRRVAVITVTQGTTKPYVVRHNNREEIYIRVGSTSQHATREQQARLFALGGMLHAELLPVSGSGFRDLSKDRLEDYLTGIVGDSEAPSSEDEWGERLCGLGFLAEREDGPPVCTIAGLVLFGRKPQRLLRQAGVRWMAFEGDDKAYRALDDRVVDGPPCRAVQRARRHRPPNAGRGADRTSRRCHAAFRLPRNGDCQCAANAFGTTRRTPCGKLWSTPSRIGIGRATRKWRSLGMRIG